MFKFFGIYKNPTVKNIQRWLLENGRVLLTASTCAGMVILLRSLGLLQSWEWELYDLFFRIRSPESLDTRIVIVGIDEPELQKYGYPINDQLMAELLQKLQSLQPRAIGLDIIYRDLPQEPGHQKLVTALENIPNIIGIEKVGGKNSLAIKAPSILSQKQQVGFNNVVIDADGKIRRLLLYILEDRKFRESFVLKLALTYLKKRGY